jgi:hypothetical protein
VVRWPVDGEGGAVEFADDSAQVGMQRRRELYVDEFGPVFRAEDHVREEVGVGVGHLGKGPSCRTALLTPLRGYCFSRFFSHGLRHGLRSYAPPGLVVPSPFPHGSRRGLNSYAPPGLGNANRAGCAYPTSNFLRKIRRVDFLAGDFQRRQGGRYAVAEVKDLIQAGDEQGAPDLGRKVAQDQATFRAGHLLAQLQ